MRRIVVLGAPGAGKSTFARRLGAALGIEPVHLDTLFWQPGWTPTPRAIAVERHQQLLARDRWILDGEYARWGLLDARLLAADTVIWLDLPGWLCAWRLPRRRIVYRRRARPDLAADCPERVNWRLLAFAWRYPRGARHEALRQRLAAAEASGTRVIRLWSPRAVAAFPRQGARGGSRTSV